MSESGSSIKKGKASKNGNGQKHANRIEGSFLGRV